MPIEMVKSIEKCYISMSTASTKSTYTLTKGQNTDNCVPFCSWERGNAQTGIDNFYYNMIDVYFEDGTKVAVERDTAGVNVVITATVYVVEFEPTEVSVQQGTWTISNGSTTGNATVSTVDQTRAAALAYWKTDYSSSHPDDVFPLYYFTSNTNLRFERYNTPAYYVSGHYYIFQALKNQWTVQTFDSGTVTTNQLDVTISPVVMDRTFIICSYHAHNSYSQYSAAYFQLVNITTVRMRTNNSTGKRFRGFVIESVDDAIFVQRYELYMDATPTQSDTQTLGTEVNLDKAIAKHGCALPFGRGTGTSPWYYAYGRTQLSNSTTVRIDRYSGHTYATYHWVEIVEFPTTELYCEGTVRVDGVLTSGIDVNLFLRENDELVGEDTTTAGGVFEIPSRHQAYHYLVAKATESGTNSVILDWLYPTVS